MSPARPKGSVPRNVPLRARVLEALAELPTGIGETLLFGGARGGYLNLHNWRRDEVEAGPDRRRARVPQAIFAEAHLHQRVHRGWNRDLQDRADGRYPRCSRSRRPTGTCCPTRSSAAAGRSMRSMQERLPADEI